ncbi:MAG: hypothetical protein EOP10_12545 [Proteobacteria bacterium]|nr:MAG: hypothetical protein EOP10_12545 [Pseudomonadota bacterium]
MGRISTAVGAFSAVFLMTLTSCSQPAQDGSKLDGHYENATANKLNSLAGTFRAVAEYEPSQGVIISLPLIETYNKTDFAAAIVNSDVDTLWITVPSTFTGNVQTSAVFAGLRQALGSKISKVKLVRQQTPGSLTVWARDWSPQSSVNANGEIGLIDFNYYPNRDADDFTAQSMERLLDFDRVSVPVYNEGGNFMNTTAGHCLMTTRVTDANMYADQQDDMILDAEGVKHFYQIGAGCSEVTIFPRMPYEGTGHIDMWAKFLNDDTVIVSELRDEVLNLYSNTYVNKARTVQTYLNTRAREIAAMGYKVIRMPTPGPVFVANDTNGMFRSYTNSLTVNGSVIIPRYTTPAYAQHGDRNGQYFDAAFTTKYEREVTQIYQSIGYKPTWITTDDLIGNGGAVHCTTMQIAR